jgi:hypothetical protein
MDGCKVRCVFEGRMDERMHSLMVGYMNECFDEWMDV